MQTRDYVAAYDYASTLVEVDPAKVVYWGSSLSGGNVICAAALDNRVRAVISQVPFVSGDIVRQGLGEQKRLLILGDRAGVAKGEPSMMVPVIPDSMEEVEKGTSNAILATSDVLPFIAELDRRHVKWEKYATLQSLFYMQGHEPMTFINRITPRPLLMVVGEDDLCIPSSLQLAMFEKAESPKTLHVIRGTGHFGPYYGKEFEENIREQLKFLDQWL